MGHGHRWKFVRYIFFQLSSFEYYLIYVLSINVSFDTYTTKQKSRTFIFLISLTAEAKLVDRSAVKHTPIWNLQMFMTIKGQLISKCPFGVIISTKKPKDFCPSFFKLGQIQKEFARI